mmetsp:Transcript_59564/g.105828  ORF Transcript_59564/g.105828 Transcript_59564/m.105828 type:complete len:136 (+) Transcript_59564:100-507(+)
MFKQPSINSAKSAPYMTFHICYQDRIRKEFYASLPEDVVDSFDKPKKEMQKSSSMPLIHTEERFPKGSFNRLNNNSSVFSRTIGPASYAASGGLTTMYRNNHGPVHTFPDLAGPMGLRHQTTGIKQDRPRASSGF